MALGEKLREIGSNSGVKVVRVHPAQGLTTEVSFIFEIKGEGRFPIGEKLGSGIMTKYSHGIIDAAWRDSFSTATGQFLWWVHEKSEVAKGSRITGYNILTGFTAS
jgi:hypothetical protein